MIGYSLTVTGDTGVGDFTYTADTAVPVDPSAPVVLIDPLTSSWGWENGLIPGQPSPRVTTFALAAFSASDLPDIAEGTAITAAIDIVGGNLLMVRGKVTEARIALDPRPTVRRPAVLTVVAVDQVADATGLVLPQPTIHAPALTVYNGTTLRERWCAIASLAGYSIGAPTGWPLDFPDGVLLGPTIGVNKSLTQAAAEMCNSYAPDGVHHALVPYDSDTYPTGYEWVGTGLPLLPTLGGDVPRYEHIDPDTNPRWLITPASRYQPDGDAENPTISARYCRIPATARRGREHDINSAVITGKIGTLSPDDDTYAYTRPGTDPRTLRTRDVPTQLALRSLGGTDAPDLAGKTFVTDPSAEGQRWVFDQLEIRSSDLPEDDAWPVLSRMAPLYGGQVVRHLTITDVEPRARLNGGPTVRGFITAGTLTLSAGRITHQLTLAPGDPTTINPHDGA